MEYAHFKNQTALKPKSVGLGAQGQILCRQSTLVKDRAMASA